MTRITDKFTYTTTYKQEFCISRPLPRETKRVEEVSDEENCKAKFVPGIHVGGTYMENPQERCQCQYGGLMPQRGAKVRGQPTNMDVKCICFSCGKCSKGQKVRRKVVQDLKEERRRVLVEDVMFHPHEPEPVPELYKYDFDKPNRRKMSPPNTCPGFVGLRPIARGHFGGQFEGTLNLPRGRCSQRPLLEVQNDFRERRDTDTALRRNLPQPPPPMLAQNGAPRYNERVPGPYWIRQRPKPEPWESQNVNSNPGNNNMRGNNDTRRAYEFTCRRRGAIRNESYDDGRGVSPYDPNSGPGGYYDPNMLQERYDQRRVPNDDMYGSPQGFCNSYETSDGRYTDGVIDEGDWGHGRADRKQYRYVPPPAKSGPDPWIHERDWGPSQIRDQRPPPSGVSEPTDTPPAARVSCVPETDISKYDQPNTFMRKLYEKYPFLYNILKETPPEELVSRVFKDRFLSTYQVDFLHMGVGKESYPKGGAKIEETYTGPEGEPETNTIPGCSYRYGKKGDFGRKKFEYKKKEKEEEDEEEVVSETEKDESPVSEYMSTISKLGGDIITDQLYKVAQITKKIRNARKFW